MGTGSPPRNVVLVHGAVSVLAGSQSVILTVPSVGITLGGPLVTAVGARHTILLSGLATIGLAVTAAVVILFARSLQPREDLLPPRRELRTERYQVGSAFALATKDG